MKYYFLKSIVCANKVQFTMRETSPSFYVAPETSRPYIEPTFEKIVYDSERPTIILISAVGATGKTALSQQLSRDVKLPLLDLGKHKPVGDNTLTGLLTHAFQVKDISAIFGGLASGTYGLIIDGIDEGRSKTNEKAFEAFLDDVARLSNHSAGATIVMLGRTQIVEECWTYLSEKGIPTALLTISPFTLDDAKKYVDAFTGGTSSPHAQQYLKTRDTIIEKLGKAFAADTNAKTNEFLSFMGYPPVLDAIVTLLKEEQNYYKLLETLDDTGGANVETTLLYRIATYILDRERNQKVIPNIVEPLLEGCTEDFRKRVLSDVFSSEEQCARLVANCLGKAPKLSSIGQPPLDEKYEEHLANFLPEHPFISGKEFRSAVFEAVALAMLMKPSAKTNDSLVKEYLLSHKHSYHLVYMLDTILADHQISICNLNAIFIAAMEFRSVHASVELHVDGPDWENASHEDKASQEISIEVEILLGKNQELSKTFTFRADITSDTVITLGPKLAGAYISVPCSVALNSESELELTAPVDIRAKSVSVDAKSLLLRARSAPTTPQEINIESQLLQSRLEAIVTNGVTFSVSLVNLAGISYPTIKYVQQASEPPADPLLHQKYLRLRRILLQFRSHSKGALAKFKHKIEHERVLQNDVGRAILARLVRDQVLTLSGNMYFVDPARLNKHLGVSWQDLIKGQIPESLLKYLQSIS
jgi:hypothetical protein